MCGGGKGGHSDSHSERPEKLNQEVKANDEKRAWKEKKGFTTSFHCLVLVLREIPAWFLCFAPTAPIRNWYDRSPFMLENICLINGKGGQLNKTGEVWLSALYFTIQSIYGHISKKSCAAIVAKGEGQKGIQIIISNMNPVEWLIRRVYFFSPAVYRVVNMPNELGFEEQITKNLKDNRLNQPQSFIT